MHGNSTSVPAILGLLCLAHASDAYALEPRVASELVTLIADASTPVCPATSTPHTFNDRLLPDGSRTAFVIPAGRVFVITSYDWVIEGSTQANNTVWTTVALFNGSGYVNAVSSGAAADSIGRAAGGAVVPHGVAVRPGAAMCFNFVGGADNTSSARAHGFLADDR